MRIEKIKELKMRIAPVSNNYQAQNRNNKQNVNFGAVNAPLTLIRKFEFYNDLPLSHLLMPFNDDCIKALLNKVPKIIELQKRFPEANITDRELNNIIMADNPFEEAKGILETAADLTEEKYSKLTGNELATFIETHCHIDKVTKID